MSVLCQVDFDNEDRYKRYNAKLMKTADPEKISSVVSQQVALVGSQGLYEKINSNFKEGRFEAFFAKVKLESSILLFYLLSFIRNTSTCSAGERNFSGVSLVAMEMRTAAGSLSALMTVTTTTLFPTR